MLLQAVEQARKTENEAKSTSKMVMPHQLRGVLEGREMPLGQTVGHIKTREDISTGLEYG